jgi:hypothetical protein
MDYKITKAFLLLKMRIDHTGRSQEFLSFRNCACISSSQIQQVWFSLQHTKEKLGRHCRSSRTSSPFLSRYISQSSCRNVHACVLLHFGHCPNAALRPCSMDLIFQGCVCSLVRAAPAFHVESELQWRWTRTGVAGPCSGRVFRANAKGFRRFSMASLGATRTACCLAYCRPPEASVADTQALVAILRPQFYWKPRVLYVCAYVLWYVCPRRKRSPAWLCALGLDGSRLIAIAIPAVNKPG